MNEVVIDGDISLEIPIDGECDNVIKVGHEIITWPIVITENGSYSPPIGVDGFDDITVAVPEPEPPPFNVLPYLTSINSTFKDKTIDLDTMLLDFGGAKISGMYQSFYRTSGLRKLVIKNIDYPDGGGVACQEVFRDTELKIVEFDGCVFRPANNSYPMMGAQIEEFIGSIDMTYRTESLNLSSPIREIRFVQSTIHSNFSVSNCVNLSVDSLISIANGFNSETPSTFDIRRSNLLPTIQSTMGNVVEGQFVKDENGSTTLESFITDIKGWILRNS